MKHCKVVSEITVVDYEMFGRDVYIGYFLIHQEIIGGPGIVVRINESLMCKIKYNVGKIL
ncbi:hypothetical protein HZS_5128 [Henneguya salminicola]|nr:hypothetical protein HZS_5128 [Henneguya salminicola]